MPLHYPHLYPAITGTNKPGTLGGVGGTDVPAGTTTGRISSNGIVCSVKHAEVDSSTEVIAFVAGRLTVRSDGANAGFSIYVESDTGNSGTSYWYNTSGTQTILSDDNTEVKIYEENTVTATHVSFDGNSYVALPDDQQVSAGAISDFVGYTDTNTVNDTIPVYIRATGYNDTLVATFIFRVIAQATRT